jgi:hypothetical protein
MMSFSTTPHGSTYPFLLTVQRFPALPSSTGNPTTQLIAVSSSANKPHQVLVQHFHPPSPSRQARLPHDGYLVDLHGSTEYPQPAGAITAIELTVTNRAALSPCLVFGTANGSLYLTRSGKHHHACFPVAQRNLEFTLARFVRPSRLFTAAFQAETATQVTRHRTR